MGEPYTQANTLEDASCCISGFTIFGFSGNDNLHLKQNVQDHCGVEGFYLNSVIYLIVANLPIG